MDWTTIVSLIVASGIPQATAEVIAELLRSLVDRLRDERIDADTLGVARRIITGIGADHPDWPGDQRRRYAADAILWWVESEARKDGTTLQRSTANWLTETLVIDEQDKPKKDET